ncbi:MAG: ABC transporter ATP-binding protein [Verrucomicrobiales bacterium]
MQIVARSLSKSFRLGPNHIHVLKDVSFEIRPGEIVFIVGPSGAGKSTLLYSLAGMEKPDQGEIHIEKKNLYSMSDSQRATLRNTRMGFVFQSYQLLPELSALENAELPTRIRGKLGRAQATALLEKVGLKDRLAHLPSELSGGEQQRVAIARALVNEPDILFADEPTGNLDTATGEEIVKVLIGLAREAQRTVLIVTHDLNLAKLGDRLLKMADGALLDE